MRSGLFMAAQPVGARRATVRGHAGVADEPTPVRQGIGARHGAGRQMMANPDPRLQFRREAFGEASDVEQDRLASLLDGKTAQAGGIHAWGTEQLRGGAEAVEVIGVLAEAEGDADFLICDGG